MERNTRGLLKRCARRNLPARQALVRCTVCSRCYPSVTPSAWNWATMSNQRSIRQHNDLFHDVHGIFAFINAVFLDDGHIRHLFYRRSRHTFQRQDIDELLHEALRNALDAIGPRNMMALTSGGGLLAPRSAALPCAARPIATLICSCHKPPSSRRSVRRPAALVSRAVISSWLDVGVQPEVAMNKEKRHAHLVKTHLAPARVCPSAFSSRPSTRQAPPLLFHKADTLETPT